VGFKKEGSLRISDPEQVQFKQSYTEHRVLIVQNEDSTVSDLDAVICYEFQGDVLYFGPFAVAPHRKGQGFGRKLIQHIEGIAMAKGVTTTELVLVNHRTELLAMYTHMGFTVIEEKNSPYPHPEVCTREAHFIRMTREITLDS